MVELIKVTGLDKTVRVLGHYPRSLKGVASDEIRKFGKSVEREFKRNARAAGIKQGTSGTQSIFKKGIEWHQAKGSLSGQLFIAKHGIQVSEMEPHYVSVKSSRAKLLVWALQSNMAKKAREVASGKRKSFALFVKPHPFIIQSLGMSNAKLPVYLKNIVVLDLLPLAFR